VYVGGLLTLPPVEPDEGVGVDEDAPPPPQALIATMEPVTRKAAAIRIHRLMSAPLDPAILNLLLLVVSLGWIVPRQQQLNRGVRHPLKPLQHQEGFHVVLLVIGRLLASHNITGYITGHTSGENHERHSAEASVAKLSLPPCEAGDRPVRGARTRCRS
jgi:hypothetical protein